MFYSVQTPFIFSERELPDDKDDWTPEQRAEYARLAALAEQQGGHMQASAHSLRAAWRG